MEPAGTAGDGLNLDREVLERVLDVGGEAFRARLVAQLVVDFLRIGSSLQDEPVEVQLRAAHELKGLAATIGAQGLAQDAIRFDALAAESPPAVRSALALGLRGQIDRLCALLRQTLPAVTPSA